MIEIGEQAALLLVGQQRETGPDEAPSAYAEPAAVHLEPIVARHLDPIKLKGDAVRFGGCRLDSLRHEDA